MSDENLTKEPDLLLVDDDSDLASMLQDYLQLQGFAVRRAGDAESALELVSAELPDLAILDVMLPGMNGFDLLEKLREEYDFPIIMLTARGEEPDRILGLMRGADDYLPKPFNPLELAARINAVLKRTRQPVSTEPELLQAGNIELDVKRREVRVNGTEVALTAAELRVLEQLLSHPDQVMSRSELTELALNRPIEAYDRSIDTLISKLRNKLGAVGVSRESIPQPAWTWLRAGYGAPRRSVMRLPYSRIYLRMALNIGFALAAFVLIGALSLGLIAAWELRGYIETRDSTLAEEAAAILADGGRDALVDWLRNDALIPADATVYILDDEVNDNPR